MMELYTYSTPLDLLDHPEIMPTWVRADLRHTEKALNDFMGSYPPHIQPLLVVNAMLSLARPGVDAIALVYRLRKPDRAAILIGYAEVEQYYDNHDTIEVLRPSGLRSAVGIPIATNDGYVIFAEVKLCRKQKVRLR